MSEPLHTNRLIHASSPYLLQHAHNPVDWWEWCEEAFEKARQEHKLVLISIGYSACHWCHVMERESFEKEDTAALMNEHFVCIKVDREERPDVDQVYMDAVQLLTGRGGWPLNCFTLPDGRPVHGGTYFPKAEWERVLTSLYEFYRDRGDEALSYAEELTAGIRKLDAIQSSDKNLVTHEEISAILDKWKHNFDEELGGYRWAPKFPMPNNWELFLQYARYNHDEALNKGVLTTLSRMAEGGIYDQAGGGFARYSTDSFWKVPHFEKMLYDNAQLLGLYSRAYQSCQDPAYRHVVYQTHEFIARELTSPHGAFYSALDADSEGVEGKFYVWTKKELQSLLGDDELLYSLYYSVDAYGNWEHGQNILYRTRTDDELSQLSGKSPAEINLVIGRCNKILLSARDKRIRPGLDNKIITSWNALMIKGYAEAFMAFREPLFLDAAKACAGFILQTMFVEGKLYRIHNKGKTTIHGFAEDYACLCEALITLYEACGEEQYLTRAAALMGSAIGRFYDQDKRLFYFTSAEDAPLIARKLDTHDDVIPSANSVFGKCLYKLGFLFDKADYHKMARDMVQAVQDKMEKYTGSYSNWMQLAGWINNRFYQLVVSGRNGDKTYEELAASYLPNGIVLYLKQESEVPLLKEKKPGEETKIYVCRDYTCGLPQGNPEEVLNAIRSSYK